MLILVTERANEETLKKASEDLAGYIKFVVDIEKKILTIGGQKHVEGEQMLLKEGSKQENLWGGGLDLETGEVDFDSMINIRPNQDNTSREILSERIRKQVEEIVRNLLK